MSFTFGTTTPKTTAGVTFGSPANTTTTPGGFSLGTPATGLTFGTPSTAASTPGLTFGTPSTAASTPGLTFGTPSTAASTTGFSLGAGAGDGSKSSTTIQTAAVKPMGSAAPLSLGSTAATTSSTLPSFSLASTANAPTGLATPSFSFSATSTPATSAPAASTFKLGGTSIAPAIGTTTATTMPGTGATTATPSSATTFVQLEETIVKWKLELEEQEKLFMSQAAQINHWDNLLNSNSEKIVSLNSEVAAMKLQQQQLDHELDFILAQQRELEEVLVPLEKQAAEVPSNSDPEREHVYHMAESLDTQVKQMSEDLREIIENINESSRTQDTSDPIVQIGRILNAHMNSLHWIDEMTLNIQNQLENVTKLHDIHRRDNERSFRISYE